MVVPGSAGVPFLVDFDNGPVTIEVWFKTDPGKDYRQQQELVNTAAWKLNGQLFVIACNTAPKTVAARVNIPGATGQVRVVSESRQLPASDGRLTDSFAPYATHIYTTDSAFQSPIRLGEIENTIKAAGGMYSLDYGN